MWDSLSSEESHVVLPAGCCLVATGSGITFGSVLNDDESTTSCSRTRRKIVF